MKDLKKESHNKNIHKDAGDISYAFSPQTPIEDTSYQLKVSSKIEITITRNQLSEATWLFKQSGKRKPNWLRQKFYIDQRRRKCLNTELMEAQLDCKFCDHYRSSDDWCDLLHLLWHNINGGSSCR